MKPTTSAAIITSLLILIFSYTALSKAFSLSAFQAVLEQVIFKTGAAVIAPLIPTLEAFIVLLLLFQRTRPAGLYAAAALLSVFTVYLLYMLLAVPHLPCSCGGFIGSMSWKQHVAFNLLLTGLAVVAIRLDKQSLSVVTNYE